MNLINQGESSDSPSIHPEKRRRGRPRKDSSLKNVSAVPLPPPGFEGVKERADRSVGIDYMVGQAVNGVIEATFDAGYLLAVRIGNSNVNLRGVVFKPGHYVPITAENDVAPHVQMIRRNNIHLTAENHGQNRATQTAAKRKAKTASASTGTITPVVLQPFPGELPTSNDVHTVEPLSMLPPGQVMPVRQIFVATQPHQGVGKGSVEEDNTKPLISSSSTETDTPGSSQTSDAKEELKSSAEDSKQEIGNSNEPLFNYGTGRMTELLQALQENMKENQARTSEVDP